MNLRSIIFVAGWSLLIITGLAGLGASHIWENSFSPTTHNLLAALGQLLPLVGLFALASLLKKRAPKEGSPPGTSATHSSHSA